ncbi:type II toxin-antitoxin system RelE/ParE family toxin [Streptomyces sp. NBC_01167]|uniref:type II toxin-antitoxin system RelE family toxin n=1 Tax=Streptomyces sp. NBC_01167 TaxID=2903756 RepID=UPI00386A533C|nr:type II toxin-antitoxin system RelE/ParE family toxin [Streptomyces sp. NBC_01167]
MTYTVVWQHQATTEFRRLRQLDPAGAKECASVVRALAEEPRPPGARQLGGSAYWRLSLGDWRILYQPEDDTITVIVLKVGRIP